MIRDALDSFLFTTGTGISNVTADRQGATVAQTAYTDAIDTRTGGTGVETPMTAVVKYNAAANASGSNTLQFDVQTSVDGTNWFTHSSGDKDKLALSTTAKAGVVNLPVSTEDRYIRVAVNVTGAGTGSTVGVQSAFLNTGKL